MAALGDDQLAIDDYVIGYGTQIDVTAFDAAAPTVVDQDKPMPREDGTVMGIDRLGGRLLTVDMEIVGVDEGDGLDLLEEITGAFMGDNYRLIPQTYQVLSYRLHGTGDQRRVFGRGRSCAAATLANAHVGFIPVSAQFQTITPHFYSDSEFVDSTGIIPDDTGGLTGPLIGPIYASGTGSGSRGFTVGGFRPAWLATRVYGPIQNPIVEIVDCFWYQLGLTVAAGDSIVVDPQPWQRQVRRDSDDANVAGFLTGMSAWLADMRVPPGGHEVILRGADPTGTARVDCYWRDTRSSL